MTGVIDLAAYRRLRRSVERDLRQRHAAELALLSEAERDAYLADAAGAYALAFMRVARPRWSDQS